MRKIQLLLMCLLLVGQFANTVQSAEKNEKVLNYHFDDPGEVAALKKPKVVWKSDRKVAGNGAAALSALWDRQANVSFNLPENTPEGVLTFWVYDPVFELEKTTTTMNFGFMCVAEENGKKVTRTYRFMDFMGRFHGGWVFGKDLLSDSRELQALRHSGWTRFDIINPPGAEPQPFIICIDGREAFRTREKLLSLKSLSFEQSAHVFENISIPLYFDEISYNPDVSSYRPNVIQDIQPEKTTLLPGGELPIELSLAKKGAGKNSGEIIVKLYDGAERQISETKTTIDWAKQKEDKLTVKLPTPPRSGWFWVEASYTEKDLPLPDVDRSKIDVQFLSPGFENPSHARMVIDSLWDFIPSQTLDVPGTPPQNWSNADSISGFWYNRLGCVKIINDSPAAWYHQRLTIPKSWKDKRIQLDIYDPMTIAYIFVNDQKIGMIENPGGFLDLTGKVSPGDSFDLSIFVVATKYYGKSRVVAEILGQNQEQYKGALNTRGLGGEVALTCEPLAARIDGVAIRTFVENGKRLWTQFDCAGLIPGKTYTINSAASAAGAIDKTLPPVTFTAKSAKESVKTEVHWENPILWDIWKPFLYSLNAKLENADGETLDVIYPQRFGFRELLTKGHLMTLNGKPLSLFNLQGSLHGLFRQFGACDWMREYGFNSVYRANGRKSTLDPKAFDEAGVARRMEATGGFSSKNDTSQLAQYGKEQEPAYWNVTKDNIDYYVKRFRNSPSVLQWIGPYYSVQCGLEPNPLLQDGVWLNKPRDEVDERRVEFGRRVYNYLHALDPTRYQDDLTTMNYNDTINFHNYMGFHPIQELIERNEYWLENGEKPAFYDECISPFFTDWTNSPWEGGGGHRSPRKVPQVSEWCAATKGDQAFVRTPIMNDALGAFEAAALKELASIDKIKDPHQRAKAKGIRSIKKAMWPWQSEMQRDPDNIMRQVWGERTRESVLNWRADGVAGLTMWLGEAGVLQPRVLTECYSPIVGFLSGTPEKRTAQDHIFAPGEMLRRSALIMNNGRDKAKIKCDWKLVLDGKTIASDTKNATIPSGGKVIFPINVKIPTGGDRTGTLSMTLYHDNGEKINSDTCSIEIIAPRRFKNLKKVALIDPMGDSAKTMKRLGIQFKHRHFNSDLSDFDTVVFGRRSFDYELDSLPEGIDLEALTRLGKNILILEQSEDILRQRFNFRTEYCSPRDIYARLGGGPLFDGLPDACLKYWRGSATLTDGYEVARRNLNPPKGYRFGGWYPYIGNDGKEKKRFTKWGNTHNVATVVIIKPDTGNFRVLADCGFALNYAAVLQLRNSRGNVVFNQVDVTKRTQPDPAAGRFLKNLLTYVDSLKPAKWREAVYLGEENGVKLLDHLRVDFKQIKSPAEAKTNDVLILGANSPQTLASWKKDLSNFTQAGGIVFSLPKTPADFAAGFLPFSIKTSEKKINQSVIGKPTDPLLLGLGNSDFYWKGNIDITALDNVEGAALLLKSGVLARIPHGKGEYVLCQIQPSMFDVKKRFWLDRSKRYNDRTLVALLSNCDIEMANPYFMRPPKAKDEVFATISLAGTWKVTEGTKQQQKCPAGGANWRPVKLPGNFHNACPDLPRNQGTVWYSRSFKVDKLPKDAKATLLVGSISGCDLTLVNGVEIGKSNLDTHVNDVAMANRNYALPKDLLKTGENTIAIRVYYDNSAALGLQNSDGTINPPILLSIFKPSGDLAANLSPLSLEGKWQGCVLGIPALGNEPANHVKYRMDIAAGKKHPAICPSKNDPRWRDVTVPGHYEEQHPEWDKHDGVFWYRKTFTLDEAPPADADPTLILGGVDDWDVTYINGKEIGFTTPENFFTYLSAYNTPRKYTFLPELLKKGKNVITMLVDDPQNSGGIGFGPVKLLFTDPLKVEKKKLLASNYLNLVAVDDDPYVSRHW